MSIFNLNYDISEMMEKAIHEARMNKYRKEHNLKEVCAHIRLMKEWCDNEYEQIIMDNPPDFEGSCSEELMTDILGLQNDMWDDYVTQKNATKDRMEELFMLIKRPLIY